MTKTATREKTTKTARSPKAPAKAPVKAPLSVETLTPVEAPSDHAHRWRIETPDGEFSRGTCRVCGAERMFPNSAEDYLWERDTPQSRWTGRTEYKPAPSSDGF
jgi:hypothetical protein